MQLVADRFVVNDHGEAIDLATDDRVDLVTSISGGHAEQARWAVRCGRFAALHHRSIARLVDYGALGEVHRFEAWRADGPWGGSSQEGKRAIASAERFCRASGWTSGIHDESTLRACGGRAVVVPDASCGFELNQPSGSAIPDDISLDDLGVMTSVQESVATLAELFGVRSESCSGAIALSGPPDTEMDAAITELARAARLQGFVPISTRQVHRNFTALLAGRSTALFVRAGAGDGWRALIQLALITHRPHVTIFVGCQDVRRLPMVTLGRRSVAALELLVQPRDLPPALRSRVASAAKRARGLPGRFSGLLWGTREMRQPTTDGASRSRAAELGVTYGHEIAAPLTAEPSVETSAWPAPGELAALRRRLATGITLVASGRHQLGDRLLREVGGFLTRRHDWEHATRAALALAESLLRRGQWREAQVVLDRARESAAHAPQTDALVQIAILSGIASIDGGRLDEAENVLSAAVSASKGFDEPCVARQAGMALARCLFWRGRFAAAERLLTDIEPDELSGIGSVRWTALRSRLAVGRGDLHEAVSQATAALSRAQQQDEAALIGCAAYAAAFAHLAVGDHPAVDADVASAVRAARQAHDPLLSLRARLLGAESQRRQGRRGAAAALCARASRLASRPLPALIRARVDLLTDLLSDDSARDVAARRAQSTGLPALTLFAPPQKDASVSLATHDIVAILQCCQMADDDGVVLESLCVNLRRQIQAVSVAVFVEEHGAFLPIASDGGRIDAAVAGRVSAAEDVVVPHSLNGRIEGGAPIRYGGRLLGAIVARWTPGSSSDYRGAVVLLTTAAAAAGPALAAVAAGRVVPPPSARSELLGTSAAISEVRRAVERAAPAPFAVLVEGESGSGKELVARALHRQSPRRDRPFCTLNCAALPDDLVESELFGHSRGAFTGALAERPGVFEEAHTGTLFLDEIGELSLRAQAKVLRTIQEGELRRVGENIPRRVDIRLVTATNRDLRQDVAAGRFRLDLLYRLDVIRIALPPLRERRDDIAVLAEHFWAEATSRVRSRATLGLATLARLARYDWPGNVRELQNVLAALAVRSPRRGVVPPSALPPHFDGIDAGRSRRLDAARRTFETQFIRAALARSGGQRVRAADELGVTRQGLTKLMGRLGITDDAPHD